jgi:hypothetical protein
MSSPYSFFKVLNAMESLFFKGVKGHFINGIVESKKTYLHIIWEEPIHCIGIPSGNTKSTDS